MQGKLILGSLVVILSEGLFSVAFFWPRNTVMFTEGTAVHSVAFLKQTASEFEIGHWIRFVLGGAAATTSFMGFLKFYRHRILSQYAHQEASATVGARSHAQTDESPRDAGSLRTNPDRIDSARQRADGGGRGSA